MAVKAFNCNKIKRTFWPLTFKDDADDAGKTIKRGITIMVNMPKKSVFEELTNISNIEENTATVNDIGAIYDVLEAILSNNASRYSVSREELEKYDIEECLEIIKAYMEFIDELKTDPN
ncbi:MAG: hypothetical protein FWG91_13755 [Lachnospiraceae bacterium]|nr:hypothetical protein [Lachnospiraceae bacterium]